MKINIKKALYCAVTVIFFEILLFSQVPFIDLGTLGGNDSFAMAINELGYVVGSSAYLNTYHAFIVVPEDANGDGNPDLWYRDDDNNGVNDLMVDLGTYWADRSEAIAVNNFGQVLVQETTYSPFEYKYFLVTPSDSDGDGWPDLWFIDFDQNGINDLISPLPVVGEQWARAADLNDNGQVVGRSQVPGSFSHHAFIWTEDEVMVDLGTLGGDTSWAVAINNNGEIAGASETLSGYYHAFKISPLDTDGDGAPDLWNQDIDDDGVNDLMIDLGTPGLESKTWDLNGLGQIVGWNNMGALLESAFSWSLEEGMTDLVMFPSKWNRAVAVNDSGCVIGTCHLDFESFPYLWTSEEGIISLGPLAADLTDSPYNFVVAINNSGQVVGQSNGTPSHPFELTMLFKGPRRGFIWSEQDGLRELEGGITEGNDIRNIPMDINDSGHIVGYSTFIGDTSVVYHALLWINVNTQTGDNIVIQPVDSETGGTPVTLTFEHVINGGMTTLTTSPSGEPAPTGYKFGNPPLYFEIETTAVYSGFITICIDVSGMEFKNDINITLFHRQEGSHWQRIESWTDNGSLCGTVDSLSSFIVVESMTLEDLIWLIQTSGIEQGLQISLIKKLQNAIHSFEQGNLRAAKNQIEAFQNEVRAQSGKKIAQILAEDWIEISEVIIENLQDSTFP